MVFTSRPLMTSCGWLALLHRPRVVERKVGYQDLAGEKRLLVEITRVLWVRPKDPDATPPPHIARSIQHLTCAGCFRDEKQPCAVLSRQGQRRQLPSYQPRPTSDTEVLSGSTPVRRSSARIPDPVW